MSFNFSDFKGQDPKIHPSKKLKIEHLLYLTEKYNLDNFVETGTYKGQTLKSLYPYYNNLYSIEINKDLFDMNIEKFKNYKNVHLYLGDSAEIINDVTPLVKESTLFWLDAHESITENPILKELKTIINNCCNYVIVIDDLRLFDNRKHYPTRKDVLDVLNLFNVEYSCDAFVITNLN